jgi:TolB-like protein/AraC-like DNA-binding protein
MNKEFIQRLTNLVEENLSDEKFGVEDLIREMRMSHSNLHRKLKSTTNQTISQFIRETRLKKARELLLNEDLTVSEISYRVGFGSPTYFNKCFHEYFGYTPGELRLREQHDEKYNHINEAPTNEKKRNLKMVVYRVIVLVVLLLIALALIVVKISDSKSANKVEKSIAVLPFNYLSNDQGKQYLANGVMDAILLNLSKIKDLRVICRTSVEQYRETNKSAKVIGKELDVAYLLEGSFLRDGDKTRLILQLIKTNDEVHVWSNEYDRNWNDIFSVQSEIAETIASELQAVITPEEKQLIRKIPTTTLTAYDFYQRGKDEISRSGYDIDQSAQTRAHDLFLKAIECDSTFAEAYVGLAWILWDNNVFKTNYFTNFTDSVLALANQALCYDDQIADAYTLRGRCYWETRKIKQANEEYDKAIKLDPNNWKAYMGKANIAHWISENYTDAIYYWHEACARNRGKMLPTLLRSLARTYLDAGFIDISDRYYQEAFKLDNDSAFHFGHLAFSEFCLENFEKALKLANKAYAINPGYVDFVALFKSFLGEYQDLHIYYEKSIELSKKSGDIPFDFSHRIGYSYLKIGKLREANYYFNQQIKYDLESKKFGRYHGDCFYDEAAVYAILGDKVNAYKNLDELNKKTSFGLWWIPFLKHDPLFENIRNEPRFNKILKDVESKYKAEHERTREWLENSGFLVAKESLGTQLTR